VYQFIISNIKKPGKVPRLNFATKSIFASAFLCAAEQLIDSLNFRFKFRFPSRSAAVIWLIKYALDLKPKPKLDDDDDY